MTGQDSVRKKSSFLQKFGTLIALLLAMLFGVMAIVLANRWIEYSRAETIAKVKAESDKINEITSQYKEGVSSFNTEVEKLKQIILENPQDAKLLQYKIQVGKFNDQIEALSQRMAALELALSSDPAKAISIALLKKDLDHKENSLRRELEHNKEELKSIHAQNSTLLVLVVPTAISMLTLTVSLFLKRNNNQ